MHTFLFYTTEGYTQTPDKCEIDNCQMLGRAAGVNESEALRLLLDENPWIIQHHYDVEAIIACRIIDE